MSTPTYIADSLLDPQMKKVLAAMHADLLVSATNATAVQVDVDAIEASVIVDMTAIRAAVIAALTAIDAANTKINTLTTKLNADAGVTDTNYATNFSTTNVADSTPAALTTS